MLLQTELVRGPGRLHDDTAEDPFKGLAVEQRTGPDLEAGQLWHQIPSSAAPPEVCLHGGRPL
ncbi:hypothetical protein ACFO1B_56005 [Dactylosporangium siamense]|uniref:hypothetical protein n=1 Tax=Dactylosporangium siamense TaxID=685454 RepID=UPI0019405A26|nr:hypothetical protein [Dactylosporangium siamense]